MGVSPGLWLARFAAVCGLNGGGVMQPIDTGLVAAAIQSFVELGGDPHHLFVSPDVYASIKLLTTFDGPDMLFGLPVVVSSECPPSTLYVMPAPYERHEAPDDD